MRVTLIALIAIALIGCNDPGHEDDNPAPKILRDRALSLGEFAEHMSYAVLMNDWRELYDHYPPDFQDTCTGAEYSETLTYAGNSSWPDDSTIRVTAVQITEQAGWVTMTVESGDGSELAVVGAERGAGVHPNFVWRGQWFYAWRPAGALSGPCDFKTLHGFVNS